MFEAQKKLCRRNQWRSSAPKSGGPQTFSPKSEKQVKNYSRILNLWSLENIDKLKMTSEASKEKNWKNYL